MKRIVFLSLILLTLGCASVFAQNGRGGGANNGGINPNSGGGGNRQMGRENRPNRNDQMGGNTNDEGGRRRAGMGGAMRNLNLTDAQKQQIREIRQNAKQNGTDRKTVADQIKAVLTPEQLQQFQENKQKMKREKRKNKQDSDGTTSPIN